MIVHSPVELPAGAACEDCGAGTGAPCSDVCPSRQAVETEALLLDEANYEPPCCPRGSLCACRTGAAA